VCPGANRRYGTIYVGSTSNLIQRVWQHRNGLIEGFTKEHDCTLLVWFEEHASIYSARGREVQMKEWQRAWKIKRIEELNPSWEDLFPTLI
jgi:putative endonuclease